MIIENVRPFGRFDVGDTVVIPDGAIFDTFYFVEAPEVKKAVTPEVKETVTETKPVEE